MAAIVLGATGSVAAVRLPSLVRELKSAGANVRVVVTEPALHFIDHRELELALGAPESTDRRLFRDRDEWPDERYARGDSVLHIELRKWADALVIAPLDAHTLAKLALGLADNLLTCLYRAWDPSKPVVLAPAMNTLMWQKPATKRHFQMLLDDQGARVRAEDWSLDEVDAVFSEHAPATIVIPPIAKTLACGDVGTGALAEVVDIAQRVQRVLLEPIG